MCITTHLTHIIVNHNNSGDHNNNNLNKNTNNSKTPTNLKTALLLLPLHNSLRKLQQLDTRDLSSYMTPTESD